MQQASKNEPFPAWPLQMSISQEDHVRPPLLFMLGNLHRVCSNEICQNSSPDAELRNLSALQCAHQGIPASDTEAGPAVGMLDMPLSVARLSPADGNPAALLTKPLAVGRS